MEHNNINPADPSRGHDDPRVRDGCVLRHLLTARDRSVFDRNMAMMRALGAGEPVTRVAKRYGVTRQWIHRLRARHGEQGEPGLLPRSRRPRSVHNRTSGEVRALIAQVRERLLAGGWDCGARSIHGVLAERMGRAPSVSTIHRILQDMGLVEAEPRKRPRSSYVRFEAELPNETWQSDFTHWPLADGTDAQIITWLDDHSRMVLLSRATGSVTGELVARTFLECCAEHGTPASTLTDNGGVYTSRLIVGAKGPGAFERILAEHGVRQKNGRPGHPTTQGKIERWHRTLKQWLHARPRARDLAGLQDQLDEFVHAYNRRRHSSLPGISPIEAYHARDKAGPDPQAAATARSKCDINRRLRENRHARRSTARRPTVHDPNLNTDPERSTVTRNGTVNYHCLGKSWQLYIGNQYAGIQVETMVIDGNATVIDTGTGEIIHERPFDTNNHYQRKTTNTTTKRRQHINRHAGHM